MLTFNFRASILESVRAPHFVLMLPVINRPKDTKFVMCAIVSGNYRQAFSISPSSEGNCELRTQSALDRETIERYLLNITITSGLQTDFSLVSVTILDANDNSPQFIFNSDLPLKAYYAGVASNAAAFTRVATVKAEDKDLGQAGHVQYKLDATSVDSKYFHIDAESGEMTLKQSMIQLTQNNKKSSFEVKVIACDSPSTGEELCQTADVFVNSVSDQHRFALKLNSAQPKQVKAHKQVSPLVVKSNITLFQDIVKALRQFTGACSLVTLEKMEEKGPEGFGHMVLFWYAQNPSTHNICRKQEYR